MPTARFIVRGKVQGVFFRASSREQALLLGLTGYARNLPDGGVELLASGPGGSLERFEQWLRKGPPAARVDALSRLDLPEQAVTGFRTF